MRYRSPFLLVLLAACSNGPASPADDASAPDSASGDASPDVGAVAKDCIPSCGTLSDCPQGTGFACSNGACVECTSDAQCSSNLGPTWSCDTAHARCVECKTDADCTTISPSTGKCGALGFCDHCATDGDCAVFGNDPTRALCTNLHTCGGCRTNADCAGTIPGACDQTTGGCVGCATDQDCCITSGVAPCPLHCDEAMGHCGCATAEECQTAFPSSPALGCFAP